MFKCEEMSERMGSVDKGIGEKRQRDVDREGYREREREGKV